MPYVTGQLVDQLLHRVRDPDAIGTSREFCRLILTHCQRILNCHLGFVVETQVFTTNSCQQAYQISDGFSAPTSMRLLGVREGNRDLKKITLGEFFYLDRKWSRAIAGKFELWAMVGRDILVIWPAKEDASTVTLVYAKLTDTLTDDTVAIELPDETVPLLLDLSEAILSLKKRVYAPLTKLVETMQKRLQAF